MVSLPGKPRDLGPEEKRKLERFLWAEDKKRVKYEGLIERQDYSINTDWIGFGKLPEQHHVISGECCKDCRRLRFCMIHKNAKYNLELDSCDMWKPKEKV